MLALCLFAGSFVAPLGGHAWGDEKYSLSVVPQFGPYYPPGQWLPLSVNCRNSGDQDVDGYLWLPLLTPDGTVNVQMPIYSPAHSRVNTNAYAFFSSPVGGDSPGVVPDKVLPVTTAEWRTALADQLARCEILAKPIGSGGPGAAEADPNAPGTLIVGVEGSGAADARTSYDTFDFGKNATGFLGIPSSPVFLADVNVPRLRGGYDACRVVVLNNSELDVLDTSQRRALLDFIIAGGIVVLPAPMKLGEPSASWLAPYMPVQTIGAHQSRKIIATRADGRKQTYTLREPVDLCEAVPGNGEIVLKDENYVHAAFTRVGLGRIVFTSFPINALDITEPRGGGSNDAREQTLQLWRDLLGSETTTSTSWQDSTLEASRSEVLRTIVGRPTVPLKQAAIVVGVYALLVLGLQLAIGGASRPKAFALAVGAAIVGSLALVAFTLLQRTDSKLVGARFATIDLSPGGGGKQREISTYLGKDEPELGLRALRTDVTLRPFVSSPHSAPTIHLNPFAVPKAGAFAAKLECAWLAEGVVRDDMKIEATGVFNEDGLAIHIVNPFQESLASPVLLWSGERISLPALEVGASDVTAHGSDRNTATGDYRNLLNMSSQSAQLRGDILAKAQTPATISGLFMRPVQPPMIAAWLGKTAPELVEFTSRDQPDVQTHALVRFPLEIKPSPVGSKVKLDAGFVQLDLEQPVSFWDASKREWLPGREEISLLGFRPPQQIGQFKPTRVSITASLTAPQHTIVVRRGQVVNGTAQINPAGPVLATWKQTIGEQKIPTFDVEPGDVDGQGRIWILLQPEQSSLLGQGDLPPTWSFGALDVSMEGEITGPLVIRMDHRRNFGGGGNPTTEPEEKN